MHSKLDFCYACGNLGFPDKSCPVCGREPTRKSMNFEFQDNDKFVDKIDVYGVPPMYRGVIWDGNILLHDKPELANNQSFLRFIRNLDKVNAIFDKGILTKQSAIVIAPAGFSKMTFAYSCIQRALDKGFSVAPLLDTVELKRLIFLASENPKYKLYKKIDYDEYVTSDVCFVTVTKSQQHAWAYEIIQEILDLRARKGLGTFVISRFDLSEISQKDRSNSFDALALTDTHDDYKYPAIIRYTKKL